MFLVASVAAAAAAVAMPPGHAHLNCVPHAESIHFEAELDADCVDATATTIKFAFVGRAAEVAAEAEAAAGEIPRHRKHLSLRGSGH